MDVTGTVKYIEIFKPDSNYNGLCKFGLVQAGSNLTAHLLLWPSVPPTTDPQWIGDNAILPILRDAYANQTPITVWTDSDNSAIVTRIRLGQF